MNKASAMPDDPLSNLDDAYNAAHAKWKAANAALDMKAESGAMRKLMADESIAWAELLAVSPGHREASESFRREGVNAWLR